MMFLFALLLMSSLAHAGSSCEKPKDTATIIYVPGNPVVDYYPDDPDELDDDGNPIPGTGHASAQAKAQAAADFERALGEWADVSDPYSYESPLGVILGWAVQKTPWGSTIVTPDPPKQATDPRPAPGDEANEAGEVTSATPEAGKNTPSCSSCGNQNGTKPPTEYGIDIGAGEDPTTGLPLGRLRFKYDFAVDGDLSGGLKDTMFVWDDFTITSTSAGTSAVTRDSDGWKTTIWTPSLGVGTKITITPTQTIVSGVKKVLKVTVATYVEAGATLISTQTFETGTYTVPNGGLVGKGVKVTDTPEGKPARVSYMVGNTNPLHWCSQDFDGDLVVGTDRVDTTTGSPTIGRRLKTIEHTLPAARGGQRTVTTTVFVGGSSSNQVESESMDPGSGGEVRTTSYTYHPGNSGYNSGKPKTITYPDGSWVAYLDYNAKGDAIDTLRPLFDLPATAAAGIAQPGSCARETLTATSDTEWGIRWDSDATAPMHTVDTFTTTAQGLEISKSVHEVTLKRTSDFGSQFPSTAASSGFFHFTHNLLVVESNLSVDSSTGQRQGTWRISDLSDFDDPDPHNHFEGTISTNGIFTIREYFPNNASPYTTAKSHYVERYRDVTLSAGGMPIIQGSGPREVVEVWLDEEGREIARKTALGAVSGGRASTDVIELLETSYTNDGKLVQRNGTGLSTSSNGFTILNQSAPVYASNEVSVTSTDANKVQTTRVSDYLTGELLRTETRQAAAASATTVTTSYAVNPTTRTRTTTEAVGAPGGTVTLKRVRTEVSDAWSRPTTVTTTDGRTLAYSYADSGRTTTETANGGVTRITKMLRDGRLGSLEGTGLVNEFHSYSVQALDGTTGGILETVRTGSTTGARLRTRLTDPLGRLISESWPAPPQVSGADPGTITKTTTFDFKGRPVRVEQTGTADRLYSYSRDAATGAETTLEAVDMPSAGGSGSGDGVINAAGPDLVTSTVRSYDTSVAGQPALIIRQRVMGVDASNAIRETVTATVLRQLDTSKTITTAADGTVSTQTTTIYASAPSPQPVSGFTMIAGDTLVTDERQVPVSTSTLSSATLVRKSVYRAGLLMAQITAPAATPVIYSYDGLGRILSQSGAGVYEAWVYGPNPLPATKITNDQVAIHYTGSSASTGFDTTYVYETTAGSISFGRLKSATTAAGVTYYAYNARGDLMYQWGTATSPIAWTYEATGELSSMKTYQNLLSAWSASTFPSIWDSAARSTTTWSYDAASGALLSKTDAASHATSYLYNDAGQLARRTSARGITTDYAYDAAGRFTGTDYGDFTPDVSVAYTRAGDVQQLTDASGTHTFTRSGTGYGSVSDAVTGNGIWAGLTLQTARTLPVVSNTGYRDDSFTIQGSGGATLYSTQRERALHGRHLWVQGLGVRTTFINNGSGQLTGSTTASAPGSTYPGYVVADTTRALVYDTLNRLSSISYAASGATTARQGWTYGFDTAWRRNAITSSDTARTDWAYTYNTDGSVASADQKLGSTAIAKQHWEYQYDAIGDRTKMIKGTTAAASDASQRSHVYARQSGDGTQYASVTHPSLVDVTGYIVPPTAANANLVTVKLNNLTSSTPTGNLGEAGTYYREFSLSTLGATAQWVPMLQSITQANVNVTVTYSRTTSAQVTTSTKPAALVAGANLLGQPIIAVTGAGPCTVTLAGNANESISAATVRPITPDQASANGWFFYRGTNETFSHDDDGNLTSDARWNYGWDAENRLKFMEEKVIAGPAGKPARTRLEFGYDAYSRRLFKKVYRRNSGDTAWELGTHLVFLYEGWNLVAELDALNSNRVLRRYVWGPDLSGTMGGAGGVGGLLLVEHCADTWSTTVNGVAASGTSVRYQAQSDGNGNVMGLMALDGMSHGKLVGRFDYDAFGNRVTNTLPAGMDACPIGFSSKYLDAETNLLYYGFRYYSPELGRWLSRDPIGISGGLNLYGMVRNDPVNRLDYLGLRCSCDPKEVEAVIRQYAKLAAAESAKVKNLVMRREYGGSVCCNKKTGKVVAQQPQGGEPPRVIRDANGRITGVEQGHEFKHDPGYCKNRGGPDWELAGVYHSHPDNTPISPGDLEVSGSLGVPNGVGTPDGNTQVGEALPAGQQGPPHVW